MSERKSQRVLAVLGKLRDDFRKQAKLSQGADRKSLNENAHAVSLARTAYLASIVAGEQAAK